MGSSEARAHSRGRVFLSSYLWKHFCPQSFSGELSGEDTTAHQPTAFILSGWEIVNQYFSQSKNLHDYLLIGWNRMFLPIIITGPQCSAES